MNECGYRKKVSKIHLNAAYDFLYFFNIVCGWSTSIVVGHVKDCILER